MKIANAIKACLLVTGALLFAKVSFAANPVLLIGTSANPFSLYYSEILKAEGMNAFDTLDIAAVSASTLSAYDVVLLGQMPLTAPQVSMFTTWVNGGGNLIAMRPDKQLAGLLGITDAFGALPHAYLQVDTSRAPGAGIVGQTIQFHTVADLYTLSGATAVAMLFSNATTGTNNPAVTIRTGIGGGGSAAAFTYDLATSIVYTRQGNPAWIGQERDGITPVRSDDLFFGNAAVDPQPDWIAIDKIGIPQADEQQRLLANLILLLNQNKKPLPRFWYFPFGKKAVLVMTGDDHATNGTASHFDAFIAASPANCSVANWECVRGTSYTYPDTPLSNTQAAAYAAQGFELGLHPTTNCANYASIAALDSFFTSQLAAWQTHFPSQPAPVTNRTHCVVWSDWAGTPIVELSHGIRLDTNYYYWPPSWANQAVGYFTGSGMPMRFAQLDGSIIDVYQAATQIPDETFQPEPDTINTLLDNALGPNGFYAAVTTNMHTDAPPLNTTSLALAQQLVASAQSRGVPVVSAKQLLTWLDGRNGSSFGPMSWASNVLTFSVTAAAGANGLQAMVPVNSPVGGLSGITRNGTAVSYTLQTIKGVQYAFFSATTATYQASYSGISVSVTPPAVSLSASQSQQFTANVQGGSGVSWTSSNPGLGTLSGAGNYIAPGSILTNQTLTVTATSTTDPTRSGSATVTLLSDATPATISNVNVNAGSNTATITWTTNKNTNSRVDYGISSGSLNLNTSNAAPVTSHSITLTGLSPATTYYYRITSADASSSAVYPAPAPAAPASFGTFDPTPPTVSALTAMPLPGGTAMIAWTTNKTANSRVDYGTTPTQLTLNVSNSAQVVSHSMTLTGLSLGTTYYFRVTSVDLFGNSVTSPATTGPPASFVENVVSIWAPTAGPSVADSLDPSPLEIGVRFRSDVAGVAVGVRFHKTPANNGTHTGHLWTNTGTLLGSVTFTNESASGWQQANFATPVAISANTTYVVSYFAPSGHYPFTDSAFASAGVDNAPLHALRDGLDGANGLYRYTSTSAFPNSAFRSSNYWVDVAFVDNVPPVVSALTATPAVATATVTWTTNKAATSRVDYGTSPTSLTLNVVNATMTTSHSLTLPDLAPTTTYYYRVTSVDMWGNSTTSPPAASAAATFTTVDASPPVISGVAAVPGNGGTATITWTTNKASSSRVDYGISAGSLNSSSSDAALVVSHAIQLTGLSGGTTYYYRVTSADGGGNSSTSPPTGNPPASFVEPASTGVSIWSSSATPAVVDSTDPNAVELGVKFRSDAAGAITALRFYKAAANTGTHTGHLWSSTGSLLGSVTFTGETTSGWQQANFTTPIAIAANTTYVASYFTPTGRYSFTSPGLQNAVDNPPLHALANGASGGNGVYRYGSSSGFPNQSWQSANYFVDVVFADTVAPAISSVAVSPGSTTALITWTTSEPSTTRVDYGTSAGQLNLNLSNSAMVTSHTITLTGLTQGTTYYYRVTSADGSGNSSSSPSSPATFITTAAVPPTITNLTAMPGIGGTARITWTTSTPSTSVVNYGTSSGSLPQTATDPALVVSHAINLTGLTQGVTYFYQVTSTDGSGLSSTSPASAASFAENAISVWSPSAVPAILDGTDPDSVVLGVKFRSDVAGSVLGVRFYKAAANTGTHIGHLWSSSGTLLATATFTNETTSGWQQAFFPAPVAISANTTYVVSYYAPVGHYSGTVDYFTNASADNGPLHALRSGTDGLNGLYVYGEDAFPSFSWADANYFVDVIFH